MRPHSSKEHWKIFVEIYVRKAYKIHFKKRKRPIDLAFSLSIITEPYSNYTITCLAVGMPLRCLHFKLGIWDPFLSNKIFLTKFSGLEQNFWGAMENKNLK